MIANDGRTAGKVVLLHGIARAPASLGRMERALAAAGLRTLNIGYPSRQHGLEALAARVQDAAGAFLDGGEPVHFVTHSMGGLVARAMIARRRPAALGRVVMLGPPNGGSEVADLLARTALFRRVFGPAGAQLTTVAAAGALRRVLGEVDYPLGVVAGTRSVYPLGSLVIPGPGDGRVSVARTMVRGMSEHLELPVAHPFMPRHPEAIRQALHFIRHGYFAVATVRAA